MPISATVGRAEIMDAALPGTLGGTYGGNPVACAAALAAIDAMEEMGLNDRAMAIGERIVGRMRELQGRCPALGDVRGLGAMVGLELVEDGDPLRPDPAAAQRIIAGCVERGVLVLPCGPYGNVIRILCPLVITDEQLDRALDVLETEVLRACPVPAEASA